MATWQHALSIATPIPIGEPELTPAALETVAPSAPTRTKGILRWLRENPPLRWVAKRLPTLQHALIVATPIRDGEVQRLAECLNEIDKELRLVHDRRRPEELVNRRSNRLTPEDPITMSRTHFFRWTILREKVAPRTDGSHYPFGAGPGDPFPPTLILSTIYDGWLQEHLEELVDQNHEQFVRVYSHCDCDSDAGGWDQDRFIEFLRKNSHTPALFFNGALFRTRQQIYDEQLGWRWVQKELDELDAKGGSKEPLPYVRRRLVEVQTELDQLKREGPPEGRLLQLPRRPSAKSKLPEAWLTRPPFPRKPHLVAEGILILTALTLYSSWWLMWSRADALEAIRIVLGWVLTLLLAVFLVLGIMHAVLFRLVQSKEEEELRHPVRSPFEPDHPQGSKPAGREAGTEQNEVTHMAVIKPGVIRLLALRAVLFWLNAAAWLYFARVMNLGRITTIHFGHWTIIECPTSTDGSSRSSRFQFLLDAFQGRKRSHHRLLFLSHYNGTFDNYLEDFALLDTHFGVNTIWSSCYDFPATQRVFRGGARENVGSFVRFGRKYQYTTQFWYSAYPTTTAEHINRNTAVRSSVVRKRRWFGIIPVLDSPSEEWQTLSRMT